MPRNSRALAYLSFCLVLSVLLYLAVYHRVFDPLVAVYKGTPRGGDFFSIPSAFLNLLGKHSIYNTSEYSYGRGPNWYPYYPLLALLIGSWSSYLSPDISYAAFQWISLLMLTVSAVVIDSALDLKKRGFLIPMFIFCSMPTYHMIWNAQPHVFTCVGIALILSVIYSDIKNRYSTSIRSTLLIFGCLFSLFSKPIVLLLIPSLLSIKSFRKPIFTSIAVYALISGIFVFIPFLNPEGNFLSILKDTVLNHPSIPLKLLFNAKELYENDNLFHWMNIWIQSQVIDSNNLELFSFPNFLNDLLKTEINPIFYKLPIFFVMILSFLNFRNKNETHAKKQSLLICSLAVISYYLSYTKAYEYQYTTLLPIVPFLFNEMEDPLQKHSSSLKMAFICSLFLYMPTPHFLFGRRLDSYTIAFLRLPRVIPVVGTFFFISQNILRQIKFSNNLTIEHRNESQSKKEQV